MPEQHEPAAETSPSPRRLGVAIAEDHYLVREGTARALEGSGEVEVVAAVGTAAEFEDAVARLLPDVVVTDIRMPPSHHTEGIDAAHRLRTAHPDVGVVVLSQYADATDALELRDGTAGRAYLLKERVGDPEQLVHALREVGRGGSAVDPDVVAALGGGTAQREQSQLHHLTDRERDVPAPRRAQPPSPAALRRAHCAGAHRKALIETAAFHPGRRAIDHRCVIAAAAGFDRACVGSPASRAVPDLRQREEGLMLCCDNGGGR